MEAPGSTTSPPKGDQPHKEKRVVVLPKEERIGILSEAAELGRLTRLNEYVVEAVAGPRDDDNVKIKDSHKPPRDSIYTTSKFQIAIQEAAERGKLRRLKPVVIENFREREEQPDHVVSLSRFKDDTRISKFLEEERQRKHFETPMEREERLQEAMENAQNLSPKAIQKPHVKAKIPLRMREDVAKLAAKQSHDRTNRIQNEENELKVTFRCQCPHCKNASPFQTNFYKSLQKEQLQRIKSQRIAKKHSEKQILNKPPSLGGIAEDDEEEEEEEEEEVVDEKLLKLRKQVEDSIMADERRRQKEEDDRIKAQKKANIAAAKAILEKTLFQPKPEKAPESNVESIDPDVLYSNTFGKAFAQISRRIIAEYEMNEEEWNQKEIDEQLEQEDLRQLTELYDRQDNGEKVDLERIYELELFDRARRDAYLSEREKRDLEIYTKRRQRTDRFIEEYEDVMNRLNEGEEIDEHRAYQLEYVVKKRGLSQDLTIAEKSAMILFETQEYLKDGLNPEDFKTSFGMESDDEEDENDEEENTSLDSGASGRGSADSKEKKPSDKEVPDAVESSDSDSTDSSNSSQSGGESSGDDSSLSYYEKDELQDLTEYKEMGEEIDMHRYMDLFVFDKWKRGEKLNEKEMDHLHDYRHRRKRERNYRNEFSALVNLQATGEPYDEERFYHLQLFARRMVGQPLDDQEMSDLEAFEQEEAKKHEAERQQKRKANSPKAKAVDSSKASHDHASGDDKSAKSQHSNDSDDRMIVLESGPSIFDNISRQSHIQEQIALAKKKYDKSSKPKLDDINDMDEDDSESSSESEEDSLDGSQSDVSDHESGDDKSVVKDEPEAPQLQPSQSDDSDHESGDDLSLEEDEHEAPPQKGSQSDVSDDESGDDQSLEEDEPEAPVSKQKRIPLNENPVDESDGNSFLSPDESTEFLRLKDDKDKGLDVKEDRLQLLRLINMWQRGESMSVQQEFKLNGFRRKRRKARKLQKEFATLLERGENGEEIDEDRMYLLELFARRQVGEKLTDDEAVDLKELEEKEGLTDEDGELPYPSEYIKDADADEAEVASIEDKDRDQDSSNENAKADGDESSFLSPDEFTEFLRLVEDREKGVDVDEDRLQLLRLINMWQSGESMSVKQEFKLKGFRRKRRKARELQKEFATLLERGENGEEIDEDRMYLLELFARKQIREKLTEDEAVDLKELEENEGLTDEDGELPYPSGITVDAQGRDGGPVLYSVVISDDKSLPSMGEVEELEELLERQANEEEIDEKRLNSLQLLMKWKDGDGLDTSQLNDLASLRYQRRKDRYYRNEFEELLTKVDEGEEVDEDRIYFLQLYARRLLGKNLSYDELVDLEQFESKETISFEKEQQVVPIRNEVASTKSGIRENEISDAPVPAPQPLRSVGDSSRSVPDPWSDSIPNEETTDVEETGEVAEVPDETDRDATAMKQPLEEDSSEKSVSDEEAEDALEEEQLEDTLEPDSKGGDTVFKPPAPKDGLGKSAPDPDGQEAESIHEDLPSDDIMGIPPSKSPEAESVPKITSRDFAILHTVPEAGVTLQSMTNDFDSLKKAADSTSEKPLPRDYNASVATTVPATEESSQNEVQSTDERSAFPSSVIEVIHESMSQATDEGRSTLDDHPRSSEWKDKGSAIPGPIMAAMEANAKLLKELDAARQATHEARERAGQEAARRAAAEDNAKYAESEAFRAKVALATAEQQRRDYVEPMYAMSRDMAGAHSKSSSVPESYLSVMSFNTKLLEQLNDTRQAALAATEQANQEAVKRALAEENARKAASDVVLVRKALTVAEQQRREIQSNQSRDMNSDLLKPYMAAMEANAKLLEQLDEARKEALQAKTRATEEALKRAAAEEKARRAALEAEKATILLLERAGRMPNGLISDPSFDLEMAGIAGDPPAAQDYLAGSSSIDEIDLEKRAQERKERAMKVIAERRRREAEQAAARTEAEAMEKEHREQIRLAVEERKRKKREALEARKNKTIEKALQGMHLWTSASTGDEALQAAKRANELLQAKGAGAETSASFDSSIQGTTIKPVPSYSFDHLKSKKDPSIGDHGHNDPHHDPPARKSNDPPGSQAVGKAKPGTSGSLQRDPSGGAVHSGLFPGQIIALDPSAEVKDKDEITHEDWYAKMEKIAMSHTASHSRDDLAQEEGSNMSPEDWYNEIEALSRDSEGEEPNADSDMKRAIEEAQRKARATNMEADHDVDKEVSEDIEAIRRRVMKMPKDEAVDLILRQVSSDAKNTPQPQDSGMGRPSAFEPDLEPSTGEDANYTIGDLSEGSTVSVGGDYELRSHQASYHKNDPLNKSHRSLSSRRSAPLRKEKGQISRPPPVPARKPAANVVKKPNRMKNISWRSNPKESFSDWRVEIKHKETGKVDIYHLHRNILGYGARKSEYFAIQFQEDSVVNGYYATNSPKVTRLDLPQAWAEMFPMVLDFMYYNREQSFKLTAHRSCAMYKWAEFLGVPALKGTIVDFYDKNLTLKNFGRFMSSAVQMKAGPLVVASKSKIGRLVTQQPNQAWRLAPQFLVTVLEANRKELIAKAKNREVEPQAFQNASCKWSKAIYICVSKNKQEVTPKIFADLTSETAIPVIDSTVALPLLLLDVELREDNNYSPFQKRCVQSIVKNWDSFRLKYPSQTALTSALQKLPSDVLTEILILSNNRSKSNPQIAV